MGARLVGLSFLWLYLQLGVITVVVGLLCIGGGVICYKHAAWGILLLGIGFVEGLRCCRIFIWLLSFLGFVVDLPGVEGEKVCVCACCWFHLADLFVIMVVTW